MSDISKELTLELQDFLLSVYDINDVERRQNLAKAAGFPQNLMRLIDWSKQPSDKFATHLIERTLSWETFSELDDRLVIVEYLNATKELGGGPHQRRLQELVKRIKNEIGNKSARDLLHQPLQITFVNREREISQFTNEESLVFRYALHAPAGYGKTWLMGRLYEEYDKLGWLVTRTSIERDTNLLSIINSLLASINASISEDITDPVALTKLFSSELKKQWGKRNKGIVLLVDLNASPTEISLFPYLVREWFDLLLNELKGLVFFKSEHNFRILFSGRFFDTDIQNLLRIDGKFEIFAIEPLKDRVLEQSVRQFLPDIVEEWQTELWSNLFYFTGGHPRYFTELLQLYWQQETPNPLDFFADKSREIIHLLQNEYSTFIKDVPLKARQILQPLSVFRYLSIEVLDEILESNNNIINWSSSSYDLADSLTQTHLVGWDRTHYLLTDSITRRIMVLLLKFSNDTDISFGERCNQAKEIYYKRLSDKEEDKVLANRWAIEYLFAALQSRSVDILTPDDRRTLRKWFWGDDEKTTPPSKGTELHRCLSALVNGRNGWRQVQSLQLTLSDEWEFQFVTNYYLRNSFYTIDSYRTLLAKIQAFQNQFSR